MVEGLVVCEGKGKNGGGEKYAYDFQTSNLFLRSRHYADFKLTKLEAEKKQ